jgi:hypothetical protein
MLDQNKNSTDEGSGAMLFQLLKSLLMILPQSTCYRVLRDRLVCVSRFRQSAIPPCVMNASKNQRSGKILVDTKTFVGRVLSVRELHCDATWQTIREESLEVPKRPKETIKDEGADRREWLGYQSKEEQHEAMKNYKDTKNRRNGSFIEDAEDKYHELNAIEGEQPKALSENYDKDETTLIPRRRVGSDEPKKQQWKHFWSDAEK